jgi:Protein of unknown function (DUF3108).
LASIKTQAQCPLKNDYFQAGEELTYDLYFKYGLIYTKAGNSSLKTVSERYKGKDAYKMTLLAQSTGTVRKFFNLKDTLSCYMTKDLIPLAFIKDAFEGSDYTQETATYTYVNDRVDISTKRIRNGTLRFDEKLTAESCIYDMMSVVFYARTLNYSDMKKGDAYNVVFLSGKDKVTMDIIYRGIETVEANDKNKYECIYLVLMINDNAFENKKEAMRVYLTNDENRMPVRLDSKLKIGSTRAILKSYKGNKHEVGSASSK